MSAGKKKKARPPKVRHVWKIRPETRVKPSEKIYRRSKEKIKKPSGFDKIGWFGEII